MTAENIEIIRCMECKYCVMKEDSSTPHNYKMYCERFYETLPLFRQRNDVHCHSFKRRGGEG